MQQHFLKSMNNYFIHKTVEIHNNTVAINGKKVFEVDKEEALGPFLKQVYKNYKVGYSKYFKMDRLSKLGFLSAELLLQDLDLNSLEPEQMAIILVNSAASLDTDHKFQDTIEDIASPAVFVYTLANIVIGEICIKHDIKGETAFFVQDKFNADFISDYANIVLSTTLTKRCVLGWVEMAPDSSYRSVLAMISSEKSEIKLNQTNLNRIFN